MYFTIINAYEPQIPVVNMPVIKKWPVALIHEYEFLKCFDRCKLSLLNELNSVLSICVPMEVCSEYDIAILQSIVNLFSSVSQNKCYLRIGLSLEHCTAPVPVKQKLVMPQQPPQQSTAPLSSLASSVHIPSLDVRLSQFNSSAYSAKPIILTTRERKSKSSIRLLRKYALANNQQAVVLVDRYQNKQLNIPV